MTLIPLKLIVSHVQEINHSSYNPTSAKMCFAYANGVPTHAMFHQDSREDWWARSTWTKLSRIHHGCFRIACTHPKNIGRRRRSRRAGHSTPQLEVLSKKYHLWFANVPLLPLDRLIPTVYCPGASSYSPTPLSIPWIKNTEECFLQSTDASL